MTDLVRLLARFNEKMDKRRNLLLSPEDIDLLVSAGAYGVLADAAKEARITASKDRQAALGAGTMTND